MGDSPPPKRARVTRLDDSPTLPPSLSPLCQRQACRRRLSSGLETLPETALQQLFDLTATSVSDEPWSRKRALGFIFRSSGAPVPRPEYVARLSVKDKCFGREFGAHALAAASPILADVYRRTCVSTLVVDAAAPQGVVAGSMGMPRVAVADAFRQFPAADALVLNNSERSENCDISLQSLTQGCVVKQCTRLILRRMTFKVGDVDDIHRAFPELVELVLIKCHFADTDVALISWRLGPKLKRVRLLGAKTTTTVVTTPLVRLVSDAGAVALHSMANLEILCLDRQTAITSRSFLQLEKLKLLRSLNLDYTNFSDRDAVVLYNLTNLLNLSVSACDKLSHRLLQFLPPNLETLNISQTPVVIDLTPLDAFSKSPPVASRRLVTLQADQMSFRSWAPLRGISSLRQVYMRKCQVTAEGAKETFKTWPELRRLDISGCSQFGGSQFMLENLYNPREENPRGDMAVSALAYVSRHIKELRVDNISFSNVQWVAVASMVMAAGADEGRQMTLVTMNSPSNDANFGWYSKILSGSVPQLLNKAFPRATLRYKPSFPARPLAQQQGHVQVQVQLQGQPQGQGQGEVLGEAQGQVQIQVEVQAQADL